jgi:hypothetical protein
MTARLHVYGTDSSERRLVPLALALIAVFGAIAIDRWGPHRAWSPSWLYSPPVDTMALYGILWAFFDRVAWRWGIFRVLKIVQVPHLSGRWRGVAKPVLTPGPSEGLQRDVAITLRIKQTWSTIQIAAETEFSRSQSLSATVVIGEPALLSYEYQNEPLVNAASTMQPHRGSARLELIEGTRLTGEYYSGRSRQNVGQIVLERTE